MKVRLIECAVLLGIIMTLVFLVRTQDGLGHSANMHDPTFDIDSDGNLVRQGEGSDPRGRDFNESDGSTPGYVWGRGWYYKGGLLNGATEAQTDNPNDFGHPNNTVPQMIYILRVRAGCKAGPYYCSAKIDPSLDYVYALPQRGASFQGAGNITLEFSGVCYHEVVGWRSQRCEEREREATRWEVNEAIHILATLNDYAEKRSGTLGGGISGSGGSISASYTHEYQEKYSALYARGFGIQAKLSANPYDEVILKQDKYASASGNIESARTGDLGTVCSGVDDHVCPGSQ